MTLEYRDQTLLAASPHVPGGRAGEAQAGARGLETNGDRGHDRLHLSLASMRETISSAQRALEGAQEVLAQLSRHAPGAGPEIHGSAVHTVPRWHFAMLNDLDRNEAFALALERRVVEGAHVLDIGSGTGLLAMMAARAGAASVTTCEANSVLAELARQTIAHHGLSDVVTVAPKLSTDLRVGVDLPRPADLVVSEIVDCGLVGEGVLPTFRHAREHLLAPGGQLLPRSATLFGALVESPAIDGLNRVGTAGGFDVELLNEVSTRGHFPVRLATWPHRMLSGPVPLASFDFARDPLTDGHCDLLVPVTASGQAHGLVAWFELDLGAGVTVRNAPDNHASHWMQAFVPLARPEYLEAGSDLGIGLSWRETKLFVQVSDRCIHMEGVQ